MPAYYNEFDPNAAQWLRELIKLGLIADGEVDDRSILDVTPDDLKNFTQCHFFAGIGVWSHALRNAGISDDTRLWTGSCPCQPFSTAGKGKGVDDERHLWPAFHWLIKQCRPDLVFGEQVAHKAGAAWFDIVSTDLEGEGYSCGKVVLPASGVGAPHLRVRQYWMAYTISDKKHEERQGGNPDETERVPDVHGGCGGSVELEDTREGRTGDRRVETGEQGRNPLDGRSEGLRQRDGKTMPDGSDPDGGVGELADTQSLRSDERQPLNRGWAEGGNARQGSERVSGSDSDQLAEPGSSRWREDRIHSGGGDAPTGSRFSDGSLSEGAGVYEQPPTGPTNGFWGAADWLLCRDGKWRPVEPGSFPLADGSPSELVCSSDLGSQDVEATKEARTMRLKGYGNAIVAQQAQAFIEAAFECLEDLDDSDLD